MAARSRVLVGVNSPPPHQSTSPIDPSLTTKVPHPFFLISILCAIYFVLHCATSIYNSLYAGRTSSAAANKDLENKARTSLPKSTLQPSGGPNCGCGFQVVCFGTSHSSCRQCQRCGGGRDNHGNS
ncbi:hypothetical protein CASFOL_034725 [Castilleja foliolosa]|uniref:Uncharacterized protein n=1 Tax=Castilleja foliolosa TaxID=1961234 RepID=A0ABD3BQN7_9LAMI